MWPQIQVDENVAQNALICDTKSVYMEDWYQIHMEKVKYRIQMDENVASHQIG